jgi:diguanylate cyclase (GGDEF)-like protein
MMMAAEMVKDRLTGLLAKSAFLPAFAEQLEAARTGERTLALALALFDVDRFLSINETHGHVAGDQVLVAIAEILRQHAGEALVFRNGGDEFAVLFPGWEREQAFLAMEGIRRAVEALHLTTNEGALVEHPTISGGVAAFPVDGRTQVELFRKADQALYRAKASGRNQIRLAFEEKMVPKTAHFTQTQLERLAEQAARLQTSEADLLREALDDLLTKYGVNDILS